MFIGMACLPSYVTIHHLAVAPQSSAKDQFYSTVYSITLKPICVAQKVSKTLEKMGMMELETKINKRLI
jgi:hypothetical protein